MRGDITRSSLVLTRTRTWERANSISAITIMAAIQMSVSISSVISLWLAITRS